MLGKVMKYEAKATGRVLVPFFILTIAMGGVLRLSLFVAPYLWSPIRVFLSNLSNLIGVICMVSIVVITLIYIAMRFYQSMVANEAYLTFTLPVKPSVHILGRLLVSVMYVLCSYAVTFLFARIFIPGFFSAVDRNFVAGIIPLPTSTGKALLYTLIVAFSLLTCVNSVMKIYLSFGLGGQFTRQRIVGSIGSYVLIGMVESFLTVLYAMFVFSTFIGKTEQDVSRFFMNLIQSATPYTLVSLAWAVFAVIAVFIVVLNVVYFLVTRYLFSKKLNLE